MLKNIKDAKLWGNTIIKDIETWGIACIPYTELYHNGIVYCTYITDKPNIMEFPFIDENKSYLGETLPNYVQWECYNHLFRYELRLTPEKINIHSYPQYSELNIKALGYLLIGDDFKAISVIKLFGEDLFKGIVCISMKDLVNFWNTTEIDNSFIWRVLAKYVCENDYAIKKSLLPKNIECINYNIKPKLINHKDLGIKFRYIHSNLRFKYNTYELRIESTEPMDKKINLNIFNETTIPLIIKFLGAVKVEVYDSERLKITFVDQNLVILNTINLWKVL